MKNKIMFIILLSIMIYGCKKENIQPNNGNGTTGTISSTGTLYFKNTQSDPYIIFMDGVNKGIVSAKSTSGAYAVSSGITYTIKAEQSSGFILYPTIYSGTAILNPGGTVTWEF